MKQIFVHVLSHFERFFYFEWIMAENEFRDIFSSDNDDKVYKGFDPVKVINAEFDKINLEDIDLGDEDLQSILNEIDREERDLFFEAYDHEWLWYFDGDIGPWNFDDESTAYQSFSKFVDKEVLELLVEQTNWYNLLWPVFGW